MTVAWVPDTDCETHEWRSASGETIRFVTRIEAAQRMMPPVALYTLRVPQAQGGRFRSARHGERLLTLPVVVPSAGSGREELRRWARALDPLQGEGTLTVVQGAHAGRQLVCAYETGLEEWAEEGWEQLGLTTLAFRAADPYWLDSIESTVVATTGQNAYLWFPFGGTFAAQPLILGSTTVFANAIINNLGDVNAWPVISALGPGTDLLLANATTGEQLTLTGPLSAAQTAQIDTRPGHKTVRVDGVNAFGRLTDDSTLWPLVPGPNRISIGFASATVATRVTFTWRNRWLAA